MKLFHSLFATITTALLATGCLQDDTARASGVEIDQTTQSLSVGALESANGTYTNCHDRTGSWSVDIAGGSVLDNAPLSVILNDAACELTLTELRVTTGALVATPAIAMTASYQATPSSFGSPLSFYGNAKLSSLTFAADFVVSVLYSDDPSLATTDNTATHVVVGSTAVAAAVPAPSYSLDVDGIVVQTDVDDVVVSVSGSATLSAGAVTGQQYAIVNASGLDTYAELDAAWTAATPSAMVATIPASELALVGTDLTANQVRTLVIANIVDGVRSYQAFQITFRPAV